MSDKGSAAGRVALANIILNLSISGVKLTLALLIGSLALLSDSIHTLTDAVSSVAVFMGLKVSAKPPDSQHPYGHGKAEQVAVLVVGVILIMTALTFISEGIMRIVDSPAPLDVGMSIIAIVLFTAGVKGIMGALSDRVGKSTGSDSLRVDAWHHFSDSITTVVVVLALFGSGKGFAILDPLVALIIAGLLLYLGLKYIKKAADNLMGMAPDDELIEAIELKAKQFEDIEEVHGIKVHDYGERKAISLHMKPKKVPGIKAHKIAHQLKDLLEREFSSTVEVHTDPWTPSEKQIENIVKSFMSTDKRVKDIHHIKIAEGEESFRLSFHLVLPKHESVEHAHEQATNLEKDLKKEIEEKMGLDIEVMVHMEPCEGDCAHCSLN